MSPSLFLKVLLVSNILFSSLIKKKKKRKKEEKIKAILLTCLRLIEFLFFCMQMCEAAVFFPSVLQDFMSRAKTMEHVETYKRLQRFAEAKAEDKALLTKQREIRKKVNEL